MSTLSPLEDRKWQNLMHFDRLLSKLLRVLHVFRRKANLSLPGTTVHNWVKNLTRGWNIPKSLAIELLVNMIAFTIGIFTLQVFLCRSGQCIL